MSGPAACAVHGRKDQMHAPFLKGVVERSWKGKAAACLGLEVGGSGARRKELSGGASSIYTSFSRSVLSGAENNRHPDLCKPLSSPPSALTPSAPPPTPPPNVARPLQVPHIHHRLRVPRPRNSPCRRRRRRLPAPPAARPPPRAPAPARAVARRACGGGWGAAGGAGDGVPDGGPRRAAGGLGGTGRDSRPGPHALGVCVSV